MNALLTLPNYSPQAGGLPALPEGYIGYFQSQTQQMVFSYGLRQREGFVYLSNQTWKPCHCVPDRLPPGIQTSSPESQWLRACWYVALAQSTNMAMENMINGLRIFGGGKQ